MSLFKYYLNELSVDGETVDDNDDFNVDELVKKIDAKIAELEEEASKLEKQQEELDEFREQLLL